jgi:hypothetical protein
MLPPVHDLGIARLSVEAAQRGIPLRQRLTIPLQREQIPAI